MQSFPLVVQALRQPGWKAVSIHDCGGECLKLVNATVKRFEFDIHDRPETLIALQGAYAIETPGGEIAIPEGSAFTVPAGLAHRPANREDCVILVVS